MLFGHLLILLQIYFFFKIKHSGIAFRNTIQMSNSLDPDRLDVLLSLTCHGRSLY